MRSRGRSSQSHLQPDRTQPVIIMTYVRKSAFISRNLLYRYRLSRIWDEGLGRCLFIMLNPSTADAEKDDPTIRRCIRFTERFGLGGFDVVNMFAYRATKPHVMKRVSRDIAVGPYNLEIVEQYASSADLVVCAWGAHGSHLGQDKIILDLLAQTPKYALGITKEGQPRHPLMVRANASLIPYCGAR